MSANHDAHPILLMRSRIANFLSVGVGWCGCCGRRWDDTKEHVVNYTARNGAFAICEDCWPGLTVDQRVAHMGRHHGGRGRTWNLIEAATRAAQ